MQNFNFNHLYYFHVVASEGGLAAAAKVLGVTQPTISEQIKQLEQFLDARLFDRRPGGGMRLNEAGRITFDHTELIFRTSDRLLGRFRSDNHQNSPKLDIGVAASVSRTFAARFFLPLLDTDGLKPRITTGDHDFLLHELITLDLDILLTHNPPHDPRRRGLEIRAVHRPKMIVVARPDVAARVASMPEDLANIEFFGYSATSRYRFEFDSYFRDLGIKPHIVAESDDVELMRTAACNGLCAAVIPCSVAEDDVSEGELQKLAELPAFESSIWAVYHSKDTPKRVVDAIHRLTQPSVTH